MMMRLCLSSLLVASAYAHGVVLMTKGANGVNAPGACVLDGTPRDCIENSCGAQADASIIRDAEITSGQCGALGCTQGGGNCMPDAVIGEFMGLGQAPRYTGGRKSTGKEDPFVNTKRKRGSRKLRAGDNFLDLPLIGLLGLGGKRTSYPEETIVGDSAGVGKEKGLPTTTDDGVIEVVYRQINQDGCGPVSATIDSSSAGTDPKAFKNAKVRRNVPGDGYVGLSLATNTNFVVRVQVPADMVCEGKVAGLSNVCFVRLRNNVAGGPFGGAGFFTQSSTARKRAISYRMKKRGPTLDSE